MALSRCRQLDGIAKVRSISRNVRLPSEIGPRASVEGGVRHTQSFQLVLNVCFRPGYPLCRPFRYISIFRRNEQFNVDLLSGCSDFLLNIKGRYCNGTDDDIHTGQRVLDGCFIVVVDLDHLGIALNGGLGALCVHSQWSTQHIMYDLIIGWILYLTSKDDDLLDGPGSLVLEELLNDVAADRTGTNDGEFHVSRHEVILSAVCGVLSLLYPIQFSSLSFLILRV